jgi:hypothetical protein
MFKESTSLYTSNPTSIKIVIFCARPERALEPASMPDYETGPASGRRTMAGRAFPATEIGQDRD